MIELVVIDDAPIELSWQEQPPVEYTHDEYIKYLYSEFPTYDGPTEFTPSEDEQVIRTTDTNVRSDLVVHAIPSNYGRIEQRGSVLHVF